MKITFFEFILLCLLFSASLSVYARSTCDDPLACYLNSIEIDIPDSCQVVNGKDLCLSNFVCQGIYLDSVPSNYVPPTTLNVGAVGFGTYCFGDYTYGRLITGTVTANVNNTDFAVDLLVGKEKELPVSVSFSSCAISSMDVSVSFTGGLLDNMAPAVETLIKAAFNQFLCVYIPQYLSTNVTEEIVNVLDPVMEYVIASQPDPLPSAAQYSSKYYTTWADSIVSKVKMIVSKLQGVADLPDFLRCMVQPSDTLAESELGKIGTVILQQFRAFWDRKTTKPTSVSVDNIGDTQNSYSDTASPLEFILPEEKIIFSKENFPAGYNTTLVLSSIQIRGLDSLDEFDLLEPIPSESNVTLRTTFQFDKLSIQLGLDMSSNPLSTESDSLEKKIAYHEKLQFNIEMKNVSLLMDVVAAVNSFVLKSYYLDQLSSKSCWISAVEDLSIANLAFNTTLVTLQGVQLVGSAGALENDILTLLNNALQMIVSPSGFEVLTDELIHGLLQGPVRQQANAYVSSQLASIQQSSPCLTHYPYSDKADYIVWANSTLVHTIDVIVNDILGYQGLNKLLSCATDGTGSMALNTSRLQVSLAGLNSFYALNVLSPLLLGGNSAGVSAEMVPYALSSLVSFGYCPSTSSPLCNPFQLILSYESDPQSVALTDVSSGSSSSVTKLTSAVTQAIQSFKLSLSLANFTLYLGTDVKVDKNGLRDTQYDELDTYGCVGSSFETIAFNNVSLTVADAKVSVNDGQMTRNVTRMVSKVLSFLSSPSKVQQKNEDIAYKLSLADQTCQNGGAAPNVVVSNDDVSGGSNAAFDWQWELFILVVGCLTALVMLLAAYNYWGKDRAKLLCTPQVFMEEHDEIDGLGFYEKWYHRLDCKNSLVCHSHVPLWLRISVPIVIFGTMAMFLDSNIDPKAVSVMVQIVIGPKTIDVGSIFDFGLKSTVVDMWKAHVYPLATLIMLFSGIWPYVKLTSMLVAWLAPPKLLSIQSRETVLIVLDVLGKWSLVDFFVMILMLCAFYFNIYIGDAITVNVTVLPRWGFYGFLLATMISLGIGHIILACHRLIVEPKVLPIPDDYCPKESLSSLTYEFHLSDDDAQWFVDTRKASAIDSNVQSEQTPLSNPLSTVPSQPDTELAGHPWDEPVPTPVPNLDMHNLNGTTMLIKVTSIGKAFVVFALVATAFFIIAGTFKNTMIFEFKGLVGLMLKDEADVSYSFVSVGTSVPEHSGTPNDFAVRWLQSSLFLFGQAMPFALLLCCLGLWTIPMSLPLQRQIFVLTEVLNAWSALDVFCIAVAAALLEIQQFAAFIVGDSCDTINVFLEDHMDKLLEGDDKCFDVVAVLNENSWLLFTGAALLIVVVLPILNVCAAAIKLRLKLSTQAHVLMRHLSTSHGGNSAIVEQIVNDVLQSKCSSFDKKESFVDVGVTSDDLMKPLLFDQNEDAATTTNGERTITPFSRTSNDSVVDASSPKKSDCTTQLDEADLRIGRSKSRNNSNDSINSNNNNKERSGRASSPCGSEHSCGSNHSGNSSNNMRRSIGTDTSEDKVQLSLWERMTMHNAKLNTLLILEKLRLVQLGFVPTEHVDEDALLRTSASFTSAVQHNKGIDSQLNA